MFSGNWFAWIFTVICSYVASWTLSEKECLCHS